MRVSPLGFVIAGVRLWMRFVARQRLKSGQNCFGAGACLALVLLSPRCARLWALFVSN